MTHISAVIALTILLNSQEKNVNLCERDTCQIKLEIKCMKNEAFFLNFYVV